MDTLADMMEFKENYRGYDLYVATAASEDGFFYSETRGNRNIATGYGATPEEALADLKISVDEICEPW